MHSKTPWGTKECAAYGDAPVTAVVDADGRTVAVAMSPTSHGAGAADEYANLIRHSVNAIASLAEHLGVDAGELAARLADGGLVELEIALQDIASSGPVDEDGDRNAYAGWSWCYDTANAALALLRGKE